MIEEIDNSFSLITTPLVGLASSETKERVSKWALQQNMVIKKFSFTHPFREATAESFFLGFLQDTNVQKEIQIALHNGWTSIGKVDSASLQKLDCTVTNMSFFDRLSALRIVRDNGNIIKRELDYIQGFEVADKLRESLIDQESPLYEQVNAQLGSEYIFHLFRILALGGRLCQYEDNIEPYLETTKRIYKDIISVAKGSTSGDIQALSQVFQVTDLKLDTASNKARGLFPSYNPHNRCYFIVDRLKKQVTWLYYLSP